jgi:hypothetical protein
MHEDIPVVEFPNRAGTLPAHAVTRKAAPESITPAARRRFERSYRTFASAAAAGRDCIRDRPRLVRAPLR